MRIRISEFGFRILRKTSTPFPSNPKSEIRNPKSIIDRLSNPKSEIRNPKFPSVFFLSLLLFPLCLSAATPTLVGHVLDQMGKPVPYAAVRAYLQDGSVSNLRADVRGVFRVEVNASFRLEIRYPGFRTVQTSIVRLPGDDVYQIDIPLLPGDPAEIETVDLQLAEPEDQQTRDDPSVR